MNRTLFQKVPGIRHERITAQDFAHPPSRRSQMHPDAKPKLADIPIAFQTHRKVVILRQENGLKRLVALHTAAMRSDDKLDGLSPRSSGNILHGGNHHDDLLRLLRLTKDALEGVVENPRSSPRNNGNADRAMSPIQ